MQFSFIILNLHNILTKMDIKNFFVSVDSSFQLIHSFYITSCFLEKRAGILKPQALISDEGGNVNRTRSRQNVAMQAILRRSQEQDIKQVLSSSELTLVVG